MQFKLWSQSYENNKRCATQCWGKKLHNRWRLVTNHQNLSRTPHLWTYTIERRGLTSRCHGSKISGPQPSFLTEKAIGIVERRKKVWAPVSFLISIMNRKVIHVTLAGPLFVEIQQFCCHGNVTYLLLLSLKQVEGLGLNFVIKSLELVSLFTGMREQSIAS